MGVADLKSVVPRTASSPHAEPDTEARHVEDSSSYEEPDTEARRMEESPGPE